MATELQSTFANAIDVTDALVLVLDRSGLVLDLNHAVERLVGRPAEEVRGRLLSATLVPAEQADALGSAIERLNSNGVCIRHECDVMTRSCERRRIAWSLARLPAVAEEWQISAIGMDISNWVTATDEALERGAAFRTVFDAAPYSMSVMNEQGSFVIVNKAFLSVNRTTQEQVVGKTPVELGIITADVQELWSAKFSNQRIVDLEEIYLRDATGVPRCYLLSTREIAIGGRPHTVSSVIDITSHKEAEAKLQEQDRRYKLMVQNLNDLLVVLSEDGTIRFVSPASEPMLGGSPEKLLGQCIFERVYPDDLPLIRSGFDRILAGERRILFPCFRYRQETGAFVHLEASGTNLLDEPSIAGIVFVVRDISERVRSERTTREWKHRYELLSRAAGQVVWDCDIEGRMVWGGCIQETLGYAPEEMLGDLPQWKGRISPEERDAVADKYGAALAAATDFGAEYCFLHKSGHYILVSDRGIPYFDEAGQLKGFVGVLEDVTARRQAEVDHARLEAELRQAQKIESIGRLAGGVAHDFNNLLTAIRGNVSLAMLDVSERDPIQESLKEIDKAAESAANLTRQLLAYSRKQVITPKVLNLNEVVQYFRQLLTRVTGEDVELRVELAERLGRVRMDPGQVEQILVNLAANARDAMPRGGTLTVRTSNTELDDAYCRFHAEATPGRYVLLEVADSGNGMTADIREHAFEPFFTTKQRGHGTGLGLATVYGITKQNGGCIEVYSEPGLGTVFKLYFPEVDAEAEHVALARPAELARGTERLVVVEDDPQIREVAVRLLLRLGYKVSAYPSGESASAALEYETEPIRLLITDVVMPGIKGNELALRLKRHWPRLKVLFTSGYMDTIVRHSGALEPNAEFLPKPYTLQSLASRVRRILDSPMVSDIEPLSDAQLGEVRPFQQSGRRE